MALDDLDQKLITELRHDGRLSISDLAKTLGVSRATLRSRLERLISSGEILGFSVVLKEDRHELPVCATMLMAIEGKRANSVIHQLYGMPEAQSIHTTNGRWDLVVELGAADLAAFDAILGRIRMLEGVSATETSLLLVTHKRTSSNLRQF
ncbi:Lrp/AsnC family transcriptional regulator [Granulosicoccus antarcticus]|uniref:Leucine-responsive regulatory protein n=1 Tax=Granulosicoccus antarcticus IMCC3135 TaxID=1192854 RepID=A0A2Z2NU95_9GAMM|nr:Lrp/AsnC family transcriptional regulator [Granulosicoccus antarcticus]ASJ73611.1 Leucine-responsive regulatory protein [Granulosicoccus antarcticus IMCC3135]